MRFVIAHRKQTSVWNGMAARAGRDCKGRVAAGLFLPDPEGLPFIPH